MVHGALALIEIEIKMPATSTKKKSYMCISKHLTQAIQTSMIYFVLYERRMRNMLKRHNIGILYSAPLMVVSPII